MHALKILIVDSDASDAQRIAAGLERAWGHVEVERIADIGTLQVALARRAWDAVLCDFSPPLTRGQRALDVTRAVARDVPFIAIAADLGDLGERGVAEVLRAGAHDCVGHDDVAALALAIARCVREARQSSELVGSRTDQERFFELSLDMLAIIDFERGCFRRLNPAWEPNLGWPRAVLLGSPAMDFVHPDDVAEMRRLGALVRAGEARTCQNRFRHGNGAYRTLSWTVVPFREDRLIYVTARDVSDRESMESDLRRAHDELESRVAVRTEELRLANEALAHAKDAAEAASRAKSGFLAHMSHEIRTPMNAILGYTQLLERDAELSSKQAAHLAVIHRASDNLLTLINDVLEMAKSEAGQHKLALAPVDVGRVFDDLESLFRLRAQAALLSFEIQRQADLPQRVLADEGKLRQILVNLLGNAVKFTKQGGVLVRLSGREADGRIILVVEVEDTGPGIAPGEMSRLFQPFAQAGAGSRSPGGTGLGLAISREFARLMSGDITVRSQLGKGAIFRLEVPVEPIAYRPRSETPTAPPGGRVVAIVPHGTTPRVLVLDDDAVARRGLADMVAKVGFDVADADLAGALDAVRAGHPPHAILLAASAMDAASMATLRALRALLDETEATASIIALTPSGSATALTAVLEAGADGVLERPYRDADVFQELQRRIGVEYTRAPPVDTRSTLPERFAALLEAKVALDPQTRADLRNAARCADYDRLNGIIDGLRATHAVLAAELARLAERFAYDDIERVLAPDPES